MTFFFSFLDNLYKIRYNELGNRKRDRNGKTNIKKNKKI